MELSDYGELLSVLVPCGARYVTINGKLIQVFTDKPELEQAADSSVNWTGHCVGWTRYWDNFIDLDYITDPVSGKVDWNLASAEITPKPWDRPRDLQKWAECFDAILPYDSLYATVDGTKIEFWGSKPFLNEEKGRWEGSEGRLPHASFSYPENMILTFENRKFEEYRFS